ncbi:hypothetical protein DKX38_000840 [Salix brachista]|uniref:glyoxylate reductase (NADP(+)) n=1 Tax=Salix brachista TaxID=2182728 RepID=A0A5N5P4F0_9ROSI|nr:hypothetical protein DKX38_000840 [Salix brachista]
MAVEANQEWLKSNGDPHLVLVHRLPSFNFQLKDILQPHFHLLDPADSPEPACSFLSSHAQSVRALICVANTPLTAETLNLLPSLELVVASSAGVDHIDTQECRRRGIILTNASTAFAEDAADYAVTLLIDVWRRISAADRFLHAGLWPVKGGYPLGSKMKVLIDRYQQDCVIQFLMGLNESYSNVRDQIMLMDPIPQVSKVFSLVQQQEKQHQMLLNTPAIESMALFAKNASAPFKPFSRTYCPHCKIQGHSVEDCFKLGNSKPPICSHCNMSGHLAEKCYKLVGYPPGHKLYNRGRRPGGNTRQTNMVIAEGVPKNHVDKMDLISNQYQKILKLLHENHTPVPTMSMANTSNLPSMSGIATCLSTYAHKSFDLGGKRVGIVGLGSIGFEVSKRLEAFGCSIAYSSRKEKPHVPYPYHANVLDLAAHSDALVLCCSLSEQTRHIINKDVMTALGKKGVVINVGRGGLIDEKELVRFLLRGDIGGAGLDVFEDEPDVPRQLFELDNVVLSPHRAIFTPEAIEALNQLTFTNLKAFFSNKPLQSVYQIE